VQVWGANLTDARLGGRAAPGAARFMRLSWHRRQKAKPKLRRISSSEKQKLLRRVDALYDVLASIIGTDRLVLKAGKLDALDLMRSKEVSERVLGLRRIVFEDPTIDDLGGSDDIFQVLDAIEEELAELVARRSVEDSLEKKVAVKMQARHDDYLKELRMQVLREESGPDNAQTLRKYAELEKLDRRHLARSAVELLRPSSIDEVVGQQQAIAALFAKIASPFPQHVLLYGPPGVGKTTVARLALEYAKSLAFTPFDAEAHFVEVNGATLRWDPREATNPLLGSVHDPIYQGARRDLADAAVPEPKPGLVTEAHGGVLFIDEIGELDPMLQSKLLKVLEDKRVHFESAYYDPTDPNVPKYIHKLFEEGAPADFLLIGATTRDPSEINMALRSRCAEVFFEPLTSDQVITIVENAAHKLNVHLEPGSAKLISTYTVEGRKATSVLADAYGVALQRVYGGDRQVPDEQALPTVPAVVPIGRQDVEEVARVSRLLPYAHVRGSHKAEIGKILGLAVSGYLGSVLEIEAVAFPATQPGKGSLRFNQTAGSMAQDSVFNAAAVVRLLTGENLANWDVHVNVVGGGRIDGPSAGAAVVMAITSAILEWPIRQDVAVTGELSIQGYVKPVGGVYEKLFGAKQAGIVCAVVPHGNLAELPAKLPGLKVVTVSHVQEMLPVLFHGEPGRRPLGYLNQVAAAHDPAAEVDPPPLPARRAPGV
jgi:ATP-dependent Lon protease